MKLLTVLHRWAGGLVGLFLAILGFSGAILVWEGEWIGLPGSDEVVRIDVGEMAKAIEVAASLSGELSRITFASEELGLHQAIYTDGSGAYLSQSGEIVDSWTSTWGRPELWLFDLHHYLFAGETGKFLTGLLGIAGFFFVLSGLILWWRTRRTFVFRLWPARMTRSAIVRHHKDLGVVSAPFLLLSFATGAAMVFPAQVEALLAPWSSASQPERVLHKPKATRPQSPWESVLEEAGQRFPNAELRRLQFPSAPEEPLVLRMRQPFEWTPNGLTYLRFSPIDARLLEIENPARSAAAQTLQEKFYPLHSGKVGGWAWKFALTLSGLALGLLGSLAVFSFWLRKPPRPTASAKSQSLPTSSRSDPVSTPRNL